MDLANQVEALLFAEGDSLTLKKLMQLLECDAPSLSAALDALSSQLENRALTLIRTETEVALAVSEIHQKTVQTAMQREERDIGEAGLEVLAILLYEGASTRADIDYIRGVNSSSTLRTLLSRRMIERAGNPSDAREYVYRPTALLLAHLGASKASDLPEYATIASELATFERQGNLTTEHASTTDSIHDGTS